MKQNKKKIQAIPTSTPFIATKPIEEAPKSGQRLYSKGHQIANAQKIVAPKVPCGCILNSMSPWGQRGRRDVIKSLSNITKWKRFGNDWHLVCNGRSLGEAEGGTRDKMKGFPHHHFIAT
jgi:hypothetical protein